jgi:excisionase family DNA binding protein
LVNLLAVEGEASGVVGDGTWLSTGEAAAQLHVHEQTVRRWIDSGDVFHPDETRRLPGRHRQVRATAVDRVLREMGSQP